MKFYLKSTLIFLLISSSVLALAGPFSLRKGMTIKELKQHGALVSDETPGFYHSRQLKNGHNSFESYTLIVSPTIGLCKIIAVGKNIESNSSGAQIREVFDFLKEPLVAKYGSPSDNFDFLAVGSIWNDRGDWMMSLVKKERHLATFWTSENLPDNLKNIGLNAHALSPSTGYLKLTYEFDNAEACLAELRTKGNATL